MGMINGTKGKVPSYSSPSTKENRIPSRDFKGTDADVLSDKRKGTDLLLR